MKEVFADTYFYLALLARDAASRVRTQDVAARVHVPAVTTAFVLLEVANALASRAHRQTYVALAQRLSRSRHTTVVPASADLLERGQSLYAARPDKDWSLADCISFVVMSDRSISEALTADHHFEQAGFVALLKP